VTSPDASPQPSDRDRDAVAQAGKDLIDAANSCAQARLQHEQARLNPGRYTSDQQFALAQQYRIAEAQAQHSLNKYIDTVLKHVPRLS
jgi:hypothetical protein